MDIKFEIGATYVYVPGVSKALDDAVRAGVLSFPSNGFVVSGVEGGGAWSNSEGVLFEGHPPTESLDSWGWFAAPTALLQRGAFQKVGENIH